MIHKSLLYGIMILLLLSTNALSGSSQKQIIQDHIDTGIKYGRQGKIEKSIMEFEKILSLDPSNVDAFNNLGVAYFQLRKYDKSLYYQTKAIELNPSDPRIYFNRGLLLGKYMYEDKKAIVDYSKAIDLYPEYVRAYLNRGMAYYFLKEYEKAINDFNSIEQISPKSAKNVLSFRAKAYFNLGKFQKALKDIHFAKSIDVKIDDDLIHKVNNALKKQ